MLLIQFGHNDAKQSDPRRFADPATDFPAGLRRFIAAAQAAQAIPVLLTPVARRQFDAAGQVEDTHAPYAAAVRQVAREDAVALIDLDQRSRDWLQALGPEVSTAYYLHDPAQGLVDDTHFQRRGAVAVACLVASELFRLSLLDPALARRYFPGGDTRGTPRVSPALIAALTQHHYVTHVRELEGFLWRSMADSPGDFLAVTRGMVFREAPTGEDGEDGDDSPVDPQSISAETIREALERHSYVQARVWKELGLKNRFVLRRLMQKYDIDAGPGEGE